MEAITTAISAIFACAVSMVTDVVGTITGNPLLLFFAVLPIIGIGIGIFKRLKQG